MIDEGPGSTARRPSRIGTSVLRCARCGKFVDWYEARLQVICGCKSRLPLPPVLVRDGQAGDRDAVASLFRRDFGTTELTVFGDTVSLAASPMFVADMKGELAGALAFRRLPGVLQLLAVATDPMWQRSGVGGYLVAEAELRARSEQLLRVEVATTNDNILSLYFYQRRGYCITEIVTGTLIGGHAGTGDCGFGGIPVRNEIRLAKDLTEP